MARPLPSKQDVGYRAAGGDEPCKSCAMWVAPDSCRSVEGSISPTATCDYYRRKRAKGITS
jgi:hypothetical protein